MSKLLDHYSRACELKVDADMTPRWRPRKKARLESQYEHECRLADEEMARLTRDGNLETPLRDLLDDVARRINAR